MPIKLKIGLKISGYWVSLLSKENSQLLPQLKHTIKLVHPWKILVHPGVDDTHG